MIAALLALFIQANTPEISYIGWSVYAPNALLSDGARAEVCLRRHKGSRSIKTDMRCVVSEGRQLGGCDLADDRHMSVRDLDTLRCIAQTQSAPSASSVGRTMVVTITVNAR